MKSKIITIEDVTKIVGITNYIQALSLDRNLLNLDGYDRGSNRVYVYFSYKEEKMKITINKKYSMIDMECSCKPGLDYCPHIALAVMYLIEHEDFVNEIIGSLNEEYDSGFNQLLFSISEKQIPKEKIELEITLKQVPYRLNVYELQVKIGKQNKYVLKKQLNAFLETYASGQGEVLFGQNFIYNPLEQYFDETDTKIIQFIQVYCDSQNHLTRNFDGNVELENIYLEKNSLFSFLELLKQKTFHIEIGYYIETFIGIEDNFPFTMSLNLQKDTLQWVIERKNIKTFTPDYEYVIVEGKLYHVKEKELLKILLGNKKECIYFKQEEWKDFADKILPKIRTSQLQLDERCKDIFKTEKPKVKYYFEQENDSIVAKIHLAYQEFEIDIHSTEIQFGDC